MRKGQFPMLAALCFLPLLTMSGSSEAAPVARMWDVVRSSEWDLMVRSTERRFDPLPGSNGQLVRPAGSFAILVIDLTNTSDQATTPSPDDFVLRTAAGRRFTDLTGSSAAGLYAASAGLSPFTQVVPQGGTLTTVLLFDIDDQAGRLTLDFLPAGLPIRIDECKCDLPSPVRSVSSG